MKKINTYILLAAAATGVLSSCSAEEETFDLAGEGRVFLSTTLNSDVQVKSRAEADLAESAIIWVAKDINGTKTLVREFNSTSDVPVEGIKLLSGSYTASAWVGDSVPASWDAKYYRGSQDFTIARDDKKSVEITCKIANTCVEVEYADELAEVLKDYSVTVKHSQGSLVFGADETRRGYFMTNSRDKDLTWVLSGTLLDGSEFQSTGTIKDVERAMLYKLKVKYNATVEEMGGAYLSVEIDESEVVVEDVIVITPAPTIEGMGFNVAQAQRAPEGEMGRKSLWIRASTPDIQSLVVSSPYFQNFLGDGDEAFDIVQMTHEATIAQIHAAGINWDYRHPDERDESLEYCTVKLDFTSTFTNVLPEGVYAINIAVVDAKGKQANATLNLVVSEAPVNTEEVNPIDIWATKAVISGAIVKAGVTDPVMKYRAKGTSAWTTAETTVTGSTFSASLTGLTPGTVYEYVAATSDFEGQVMKFTTEEARQMPNSSFEDSFTSKYIEFYKQGGEKFWDSGNRGSSTMSKNVTEIATDKVHSGSQAVVMKSQFVGVAGIGAFAAGNIFAGDFLGTEGTNGVLGWGRAWNSRPEKLSAWIHYTPAKVEYDKDGSPLKNGDMDQGIIYVALVDDSKMEDFNGSAKYPQIIKTKTAQLFDPNGSNVIAYGKIVLTEATAGSDLVKVEVPLEYRRTDVKPSYILCVASASIGGDYFSGGKSVMYLDDITLEY